MSETFGQTVNLWRVITHLGSASLIAPTLAVALIGLGKWKQKRAAYVWLLALAFAVLICLATKIAFLGWGIGIATLNFTGISGHTLLSTAILPVLFYWIVAWKLPRFRLAGAALGLILGLAVAISRIELGAHSPSEVVAGWLAGC